MILSIILPCYNVERFISDTLKVLASQVLDCNEKDEIEIIAVNDGSKDKTCEIIKEFCKTYPFIQLIDQENKGVSVARNVGMDNARGQYICFMDSDDTLADGTIKFYLETIKKHTDCQMFGFGYKTVVNGKDGKKYSYFQYDNKILDNLLLKQIFLSKKICFNICSCIYESKFLRTHNIAFTPNLKIGEDIEFLLYTINFVNRMYYSSRIGFIYQIRNDSAMQGYKNYSVAQYHSFEVRRDIVLNNYYQSEELKNFSNFWIENQLLSNVVYYLRSDFNDSNITENLIKDCDLLRLSIKGVKGAIKNKFAICLAKILPMKLLIKISKKKEVAL